MSAASNSKLDWTARPFAELVRLAWPITISTLSYATMSLVDTLFVGRLGAESLAGVGLGGVMAFTLLCFSIGLLRGVKVVVSQAAGAGRREVADAYLGAGLALAVALGALSLALGQLIAPLASFISDSAGAGLVASDYMRVRVLGAPLVLSFVALRETRYGLGDARSPMIASLIGNATNIVLDYVFIFVVGWGAVGAAAATVIAQGLEAGVLVAAQWSRGFGMRVFRWEHVAAIGRVGVPTGIQFSLEVGSFMVLAGLIASFGALEMAAHQIALQVTHVTFLPAFALAEAASTLVGQAVGARRDDLVRRIAVLAMAASSIYTGTGTVVFALCAGWIASQFTGDAALVASAAQLLYVAAVFQVADAANVVARGVLRGTGDVRVPALIGIVTAWLMVPPLTWLLGSRLGLGALGGWIGLCAELMIGAALLWWRLAVGHWRGAAAKSRANLAREASA